MLSKELTKAIVSSVTGKYSVYIVQLASLAILSRLFSPAEFGVLASVQVFVVFFQVVAASGLAPAIIYQKEINEEKRDGIFTFTLVLGLALIALFFLATPHIHRWYGLASGVGVFYAVGLCVFLSSLSMMPLASLQKDSKFLVIARCETLAEIAALACCFLSLLFIDGVYALVAKVVAVFVFRFILYYAASVHSSIGRAKFGRKVSAFLDLFDFVKYQLGFNILNYFSRNLDTILIAKYFGAASLGLYEKTYQVMRYPLLLFTSAVNPALQPILTKYRDSPDLVSAEYFKICYKLAFVGAASSFILFWQAESIIYILFGESWVPAAEYLRILAVSVPVQMVLSSTGSVYQSFGATKAMFVCGVFSSIVNVAAIILGAYMGSILLICFALCASFSLSFFQCFWMLRRKVITFTLKQFLSLSAIVFLSWGNFFLLDIAGGSPESFFAAVVSVSICSLVVFTALAAVYIAARYLPQKSA